MKILIGTPIHEVKDYSMERWLENVAKLTREYPADLFMVDNSLSNSYMKKVKGYCAKYRITDYKIVHFKLPPEQKVYERVARSREVIRQEFLSGGYEAWFSWECDQIIPIDALKKLVRIMKAGDFMMVNHNSWLRDIPDRVDTNFGVSLISREALKKYGFLLEFGTDPEMPSDWQPSEAWFKKRVLRGGGNSIEVQGVIDPIYHLNE